MIYSRRLSIVATLVISVGQASAVYLCNVCRDSPSGQQPRTLADPNQSFVMNGETWTCGYLQDTVQDVNPYSGAPGEARWCALAQLWAENNCDCVGPEIAPTTDNYKDPNPACDLCAGQMFDAVPQLNSELAANTGVAGVMNCLGLYNAMAEGVLSSNLCPSVQANAGPVCCSLESVVPGQGSGGGSSSGGTTTTTTTAPSCLGAASACESGSQCCDGLECQQRSLTGPFYCSSGGRTRPRLSIAGAGFGGAAGRERTGN